MFKKRTMCKMDMGGKVWLKKKTTDVLFVVGIGIGILVRILVVDKMMIYVIIVVVFVKRGGVFFARQKELGKFAPKRRRSEYVEYEIDGMISVVDKHK